MTVPKLGDDVLKVRKSGENFDHPNYEIYVPRNNAGEGLVAESDLVVASVNWRQAQEDYIIYAEQPYFDQDDLETILEFVRELKDEHST